MRLSLFITLTFTNLTLLAGQEAWEPDRIVGLSEYPPLARSAHIEGVVEVRCALDKNGSVLKARAVSGHALLMPMAAANASKWHFHHAPQPHAAESEARLTYTFQLKGEPVRNPPKVEFIFERPDRIFLTAEPVCADHVPCTPGDARQSDKESKKGALHSIP